MYLPLNAKMIFGISKIDGLLFKQMYYLSFVTFFHDILLRVFKDTYLIEIFKHLIIITTVICFVFHSV